MIDYKRWKQLHESFGFPLAVRPVSSLGLLGTVLDEKKHSKKMFGDVEDAPPADDAEVKVKVKPDDEDDDSEDDHDHDNCSCDCHKKGDMKGGDVKAGPPMMCKKCSKKMKKEEVEICDCCKTKAEGFIKDVATGGYGLPGVVKGAMSMKKKMKKESFIDSLADDYGTEQNIPQTDDPGFREEFFKSLARQFGNPNQKFSDGTVEEDVLVSQPGEVMVDEPQPGQVGYAPVAPVGGSVQHSVPEGNWDNTWTAYVEPE